MLLFLTVKLSCRNGEQVVVVCSAVIGFDLG